MPNFYGDNANNTLVGSIGSDDIRGYAGNDWLDGAGGNDTMRGGADHDIYITDGGDTLIELANQGTDEVRASVSFVLGANLENLLLTGTAAINGTGNGANNLITGNAANNLLSGAGGHDEFFVSGGIDTIVGGSGADGIRFDHSGAAVLHLAAGTYGVSGGAQGTVSSVSHAIGSAFDDQLTGNNDINHLSGGAGSDTLTGGGGNDQLWGGPGSDRLVADAGSDTLVGNSDTLLSPTDAAADIFEIRPGAGAVTITDFQPGVDRIDLSAFGFDANGHSSVWTANGSADPQNTVLQLTHNGSGAVVSITLQGQAQGQGAGLTMADFIGGSPALLPPAGPGAVPGGNGVADVFLVDPGAILAAGGVLDITGFEDGLDVIDLRPLDLNSGAYWDGWFYDHGASNQTRLEFWGLNNEFIAVNLVGHNYAQADASDFIL